MWEQFNSWFVRLVSTNVKLQKITHAHDYTALSLLSLMNEWKTSKCDNSCSVDSLLYRLLGLIFKLTFDKR
ncbi:hypothetical protein T02_10641 [Trichinella nativa]|uniref:Uncharacterized protein n=1 Tax=Trichinella nativa TaxID=6335 RepID=A0A0V1L152_9BILA|nr:hypothetical protein T02_10641 [Trichinella nativa]